ncbi:porin family protein [Oceanobacter mangrovi]|uniref:porin family protein n=1 Tax=Oceanobacter mangrovi TaxID=2862510 RepID=UPI001C8D2AC1|nr:porin family protein [Oceanobacter mangrovi]
MLKHSLIATAILLASSTVFATPDYEGWYVGGSFGGASIELDPDEYNYFDYERTSAAITSIYGGYNFTSWFGVDFDVTQSSEFDAGASNADAKLFGTSVAGIFHWRFSNHISLYGRTGIQFFQMEQTVDYLNGDESNDWTGAGLVGGIGAEYQFNSGITLRLDYRRTSTIELDVKEKDDDGNYYYWDDSSYDLSYNATTIGMHYQF